MTAGETLRGVRARFRKWLIPMTHYRICPTASNGREHLG